MYSSKERGVALITTLLVMALMSALLVGFTAVVMSDQRYRFIDRNRGQSFYAAAGGVEKLTADLGNLFYKNVAPTGAQVTALVSTSALPTIADVTYTAAQAPQTLPTSSLKSDCLAPSTIKTVGQNGYTIKFCADAAGNPIATEATTIKTGPYEGLIAQQTPYQMDVTASTKGGGETHLVRTMESVAIPVFQFGVFSDVDLSFFAGPNFNFGGRVHTNGNLFLAQGAGTTLTLNGKVTAVQEIVRQRLQNTVSIDTAPHTGTVSMAKAAGVFQPLLRTWGSLTDGLGSGLNEPTWHTTSLSTYNTWIRNSRTGAKPLNLPLITVGGSNPALVQRPPVGEDLANNVLYNERLYTKGSIRILLSDLAADIQTLPGIDTTRTPVQLDGDWRAVGGAPANPAAYGPVDATHPPIARTAAPVSAVVTTVLAVAAGTNRTLPIPVVFGIGLPLQWRVPQIRVNKLAAPAALWDVNCTGKTATTFIGCTNVPLNNHPAVNMAAAPNTPTVTTVIAPPDGSAGIGISTPFTLTWPLWSAVGNDIITVASTMAFAPNTFWLGSDLVTCGGYNTAVVPNTLTNCTIPNALTAATNYTITTAARSNVGTGTIGGFIKIERQNVDSTWSDITMEILNYGIGNRNLIDGANGTVCNDPTPNAILRIQRLRSNKWTSCTYPITNAAGVVTPVSSDYEPNVLFDTREGLVRDVAPAGTSVRLGGVMYYINLDVDNLSRWFAGVAPYTGALAGTGSTAKKDNGGFTVYFSDRRNNRDAANKETAEYGWEDFVNPNSATGAPDGLLNGGEDVNASALLDTYGQLPSYNGAAASVPPGATAPLDAAARPATMVTRGDAQANRSILFRHALKLTNGSNIRARGVTGLTIVAENPVYVHGDWNAVGAFSNPHAATSIIADAVTLLSGNWNDAVSFTQPYAPGNRVRTAQSWYRVAIIAGKGPAFPKPGVGAPPDDFGTDGGVHNFLRYLESGGTLNYQGSIATFYFNRQAVGTYKCCNTVYSPPTRAYAFDIDFLNPALLPPNTPVFRDMNAVGFAQEMRPGR